LRKICFYIAIFSIFACKKEIIIEIEDRPPQLVVNAVLDPDSFLYFHLSQTQNITDNNAIPYITNATVEVFNKDTTLLTVLSHNVNGDYRSGIFKPRPDSQYLFRINTVQGAYWVNELMPDTMHCVIKDTTRSIFLFQVRLDFTDPPLPNNYYGIKMKRYFEVYNGADTTFAEEWVALESIDFILTENPRTKFSKKNILFTDQYFIHPKQTLRIGAADLFNKAGQKTKRLVIHATAYSFNGYNYYASVNEHLFYQNDPFSQPTLLVGNIPGAFGAAVGKNTKTLTIWFK
jgi:hypothetical protein